MREILFRGKRKHNGEWVNSKSIIRFINPDNKVFIAGASKYDNLTIHADSYIVNASSLMGILSLDLDKPINLCWESPKMSEKIQKDFEQWGI